MLPTAGVQVVLTVAGLLWSAAVEAPIAKFYKNSERTGIYDYEMNQSPRPQLRFAECCLERVAAGIGGSAVSDEHLKPPVLIFTA